MKALKWRVTTQKIDDNFLEREMKTNYHRRLRLTIAIRFRHKSLWHFIGVQFFPLASFNQRQFSQIHRSILCARVQCVVDVEQSECGAAEEAIWHQNDEKTHLHEIDFVWNFNTSNYLHINHSPLIGLLEIIHTQEPHGIPE